MCCAVCQAESFFSEQQAAAAAAAAYSKQEAALARRVAQLPRPVMAARGDTSLTMSIDKRAQSTDGPMAVSVLGPTTSPHYAHFQVRCLAPFLSATQSLGALQHVPCRMPNCNLLLSCTPCRPAECTFESLTSVHMFFAPHDDCPPHSNTHTIALRTTCLSSPPECPTLNTSQCPAPPAGLLSVPARLPCSSRPRRRLEQRAHARQLKVC